MPLIGVNSSFLRVRVLVKWSCGAFVTGVGACHLGCLMDEVVATSAVDIFLRAARRRKILIVSSSTDCDSDFQIRNGGWSLISAVAKTTPRPS